MLHTQGRDAHLCLLAFIFMSLLHKTKMKDCYLLKDEMRTCAFSLSIFMSLLYKTRNERLVDTQGRNAHPCLLAIFMSFFHTTINERLAVAQGRAPLAYVTHTGTRCAPVPSRFYLHVVATQNKNERLVFTQGRDAHLCLLAFYLHVLILQNQKRKTGSYSGTRCAPVPSRFLSSCRSYTQL